MIELTLLYIKTYVCIRATDSEAMPHVSTRKDQGLLCKRHTYSRQSSQPYFPANSWFGPEPEACFRQTVLIELVSHCSLLRIVSSVLFGFAVVKLMFGGIKRRSKASIAFITLVIL